MYWFNKSHAGALLMLFTAFVIGYVSTKWIVRPINMGEAQPALSISEALVDAAREHTDKIVFPDSAIDLYTGEEVELSSDLSKYPYIIISIISVRCSRCVEEMPSWDILVNDFETRYDVRIVFFVTGPTREYVKYLHERLAGRSSHPLYYDASDEFTTMNHLGIESRTFLLGPDRKMILAGTPAGRTDITIAYMDYLGKVTSK